MSHLAKQMRGGKIDWDTPYGLDYPTQALMEWKVAEEQNSWQSQEDTPPTDCELWTDASDDFWAYLLFKDDILVAADQGPCIPDHHIFLKEAYAADRGVDAATRLGLRHPTHKCDNMALVFSELRWLSSSPFVNGLMANWTLKGVHMSPEWVSTHQMRADPYTRGIHIKDAPRHAEGYAPVPGTGTSVQAKCFREFQQQKTSPALQITSALETSVCVYKGDQNYARSERGARNFPSN
jgi:hypothetical protein